ncbi:MAG: response regulator [Alphaproteobacteria bacterium]
MNTPLRVLLVEDSEDDVELILRELRRGGYEPKYRRVQQAATMIASIEGEVWDLILCDFTLPGFSGPQALSIVRDRRPDVPFIFVSGTIGEEAAVAAMKAGAQDYVIKDNLRRLVPVIERELREADVRRDRARAEAERRAAEFRFRQVLTMAPDAIVAVDEDHRITIFNRAAQELFGYSAEEVLGRVVDLLLLPCQGDASGEPAAPLTRFPDLAKQVAEPGEVAGRRKTGEEFPAEASFSEFIENGRTTFMAVIRDITQRKALEEQLRQSQKMEIVGQLTGGLAHDFNNLLLVVIGNLELIQEQFELDAQALELAANALQASWRGAELTRKLLAFSREQSLQTAVVQLNERVAGMAVLLRRTLGEHIEIELATAEDLWLTETDPVLVEAAVMNLAINARDAMPDGGRLTIETANAYMDSDYTAHNPEVTPGEYVMIAVTDTGTGIAPENLSRVFEPFFTTKEVGKGTGLGLSMVYGFARKSGGHVKLYSEVGHGTTVRIYLPRAAATRSAPAGVSEAEAATSAKGELVLVVEDKPDVRQITVAQLKDLGYRTVEAPNATVALDLIARMPEIDVLFTDIVMPGDMTGYDLGRAAQVMRPGLRVLYTSGFTELSLQRDRRGGGPVHRLSKPYRRQDLALKLREVLRDGDPPS